MANFVHLHVHSEYSLLDGLPKIKNLVGTAKEMGMKALALTDHGVMYGAIEFYKECLKQEVKPIVGIETYIVNQDHQIKDASNKENLHLVLLAKNNEGYKNLMRLATIAALEGYYYRPRIDKEILKKYSKGLIALTACPKGEIGQLLIEGHYQKAKKAVNWYSEVFGEGNFYLEIQRHQYKDFIKQAKDRQIIDELKKSAGWEKIWVDKTIELSRELGIPLVATNDVHYVNQKDAFAQDVLVCISTGKQVEDLNRLRYVDNPTFHLRSEKEMREIFADVPDAVDNTAKVAKQIDLKISLGSWRFPKIDLPEGETAGEQLEKLTWERVGEVYQKIDKTLKERINFELDVIIKKGYPAYFLMMADMVNWCTNQGIITTTRGSAAGSVVSYILGITSIDPIHYSLPFERFLNPFRPKPPDIDLDIADNRREELIVYTTKKYGKDKVAQICTFGRMLARGAARDVGRALGHPYAFPDQIAKLIPLGAQGFPMTIEKALEVAPELKSLYDSDEKAKQVLDVAQEIEGNARHASVHAAGIVISPTEMTNFTPLQLEPKGEKIITQYEMHACEDIGLVKFDFLGLRNLSILGAALKIIKGAHGVEIDLKKIPLDDKKTFKMLTRGETMGVFQLSGSGMTKWLKELKPNRIDDIMQMIALFRPGPMANIPEFIARKSGKRKVRYIHPKMEAYLEKSYGILVYQEDVMFTAIELAGYDWKTVDKLRTAIGKKIPEEMARQHKIFVKGCQKHSNLSEEEAEKIWELFVPFQSYGFNKAHAAAYGMVSYQTAYLKAHWPVEYMTALLTAESGNTDKITEAIAECKRMGIKILPPDINVSKLGFRVEKEADSLQNKGIRFGLDAIKNVGSAAISSILAVRDESGSFESLTDFCTRVDGQKVNKKVLESLIKVGAMDHFGKRSALLQGLDAIRSKCLEQLKRMVSGQEQLFDLGNVGDGYKMEDDLPSVEELDKKERLSLEKELLGFFLSDHPLNSIKNLLSVFQVDQTVEITKERQGEIMKVGGIIMDMRNVFTKKNNQEMAFVRIEDTSGSLEVVVFPQIFASSKDLWVKDKPVMIKGKVSYREEEVSLVAEEVFDPEDQEMVQKIKEGQEIEIKIPANTPSVKLMAINKLLRESLGKQKIVLVFINGESNKKMPLPYKINYDRALEQKIKEIIE